MGKNKQKSTELKNNPNLNQKTINYYKNMESTRMNLDQALEWVMNDGFTLFFALYSLLKLNSTIEQNTRMQEKIYKKLCGDDEDT